MSTYPELVELLESDQYRYVKETIIVPGGTREIKRKEYTSPTEFILSLSKKKYLKAFLSKPFHERDIPILLRLLAALNAIRFSEMEAQTLYSFLCGSSPEKRRCSSEQLVSTAFSYSYPTIDTLPYHYVAGIAKRISPLLPGDYASDTIYIMEILGVMIGVIFTHYVGTKETVRLSHFDAPIVQIEFQNRYPSIAF